MRFVGLVDQVVYGLVPAVLGSAGVLRQDGPAEPVLLEDPRFVSTSR
jgi:hypothetical protein